MITPIIEPLKTFPFSCNACNAELGLSNVNLIQCLPLNIGTILLVIVLLLLLLLLLAAKFIKISLMLLLLLIIPLEPMVDVVSNFSKILPKL